MGVLHQGLTDVIPAGNTHPTSCLRNPTMADKSRDQSKAKKENEKKQPQPVELTDDQLRAITGGDGGGGSSPAPSGPILPSTPATP
jgi:hypothetical protein